MFFGTWWLDRDFKMKLIMAIVIDNCWVLEITKSTRIVKFAWRHCHSAQGALLLSVLLKGFIKGDNCKFWLIEFSLYFFLFVYLHCECFITNVHWIRDWLVKLYFVYLMTVSFNLLRWLTTLWKIVSQIIRKLLYHNK